MEWYLVGGELGGEEGDADDDEEEAVQARTHDEERRPAKKERGRIKESVNAKVLLLHFKCAAVCQNLLCNAKTGQIQIRIRSVTSCLAS